MENCKYNSSLILIGVLRLIYTEWSMALQCWTNFSTFLVLIKVLAMTLAVPTRWQLLQVLTSISKKACALLLQLEVDAFHGHTHNWLCQLLNHPPFLKGFGLKDLAMCERVFAGMNPAMCLVQHASSYFYWLQFLDLQMDQWDKDKYLELSKSFFYSSIHF